MYLFTYLRTWSVEQVCSICAAVRILSRICFHPARQKTLFHLWIYTSKERRTIITLNILIYQVTNETEWFRGANKIESVRGTEIRKASLRGDDNRLPATWFLCVTMTFCSVECFSATDFTHSGECCDYWKLHSVLIFNFRKR